MKGNKAQKNKVLEEVERQLYDAITQISNAKEAQQFFEDLCTPAERQSMADRWRVVKPLKEGKAYRQIYEDTGVSITTVGRVARSLQFGTDGYNLIYERVENHELRSKLGGMGDKPPASFPPHPASPPRGEESKEPEARFGVLENDNAEKKT